MTASDEMVHAGTTRDGVARLLTRRGFTRGRSTRTFNPVEIILKKLNLSLERLFVCLVLVCSCVCVKKVAVSGCECHG